MTQAIQGQGQNHGNCMITDIDFSQSAQILCSMSNIDVRYHEFTLQISDQHLPLSSRWVIVDRKSPGLMTARREQVQEPGGAFRKIFS
jgi:hypothetical protein